MTLTATAIVCAIIALLGIYFQVRYSARAVTQGPALLTMLGIAGTFLGIAIGLYHFNASDVQGSIPGLLDGIRTSVWASFTGIFFAILLKVRYALAREENPVTGDQSDVEVLVEQLQSIKKSIALDGDLTLISEIKLLRSDTNYRLDALQRAQTEVIERLAEANPENAVKRLGLRLHADEEHWIPLADLMTGLMFLFLLIALAYMVQVELQQRKPKDALAAYAQTRTQLYHDLDGAFAPDLAKWGAQLDPNTLAIRFLAGNVLFTPGSAEISPRFKTMLDDFFPRYLRVLSQPQYRDIISEVRIEGFTSSFWRSGASVDESYIGNLALSQDRARSVAAYVLAIPAVQPQKAWLMRVLAANGLSSSHLMYHADGSEDADASQRVEFGVRTNADAQVRNVLALSAPPSPNAAGSEAVTVDDSMPPFASWAAPMIGKPLAMYFPKKSSRCLGYLDGAILKYAGARTGTQVYGWSFDPASEAPLSRVLLTDAAGTIAGAGDGGFPRPDVPAKLAQIASPTTGWEGYVAAVAQPIAAWGVTGAPGTVCRLQPARAFGNGW